MTKIDQCAADAVELHRLIEMLPLSEELNVPIVKARSADVAKIRESATALVSSLLAASPTEGNALAALRELVRLKDIHDHIEAIAFDTMDEYRAAVQEYNAKKPKAWGAARACLDATSSPQKEST